MKKTKNKNIENMNILPNELLTIIFLETKDKIHIYKVINKHIYSVITNIDVRPIYIPIYASIIASFKNKYKNEYFKYNWKYPINYYKSSLSITEFRKQKLCLMNAFNSMPQYVKFMASKIPYKTLILIKENKYHITKKIDIESMDIEKFKRQFQLNINNWYLLSSKLL